MIHPPITDGSGTRQTNFNGEVSTYPSIAVRMDPFSTAAERVALARPMEAIDLDAFLTAADLDPRPAQTAWRGFDPMFGQAFYMAGDGRWRHTLDDSAYQPGGIQ